MTKIEELEAISRFLLQEMADMPSFVTLGTRAYATLQNEMSARGRYYAGNQMPTTNLMVSNIYLSAGNFTIYVDPKVHVDRVSIGTMSIGDVLPSLRFFKTLDRLDLPTPIPVAHL
jgi:hypothetical protein